MRDAAHYRRMMTDNPHASVGVSLAAAAVYASRYGVCEAEDRDSAAYRRVYRDLANRYGEALSASEVLREMEAAATEPVVELTTEHSASSYGVPVLVLDGLAYGPGDVLPSGEQAASLVGRWSLLPERTPEELDDASRYLAQAGGLVSAGDIARLAGVEAVTVRAWVARYPDFPSPAARTSGGDIYWRNQIEDWLRRTGRLA
jgi:hypothetical protein